MLSRALAKRIAALLKEGKTSQRQIAKITGASRGTVNAIASGKRGNWGQEETPKIRKLAYELQDPPERCPGCGGLVYMPCQLCRVTSLQECGMEITKAAIVIDED